MRHFMRSLLFFASVLLCALAPLHAGENVSPQTLAQRLNSTDAPLVVDVRSVEEYAAGHVPGAKLIPHDQMQQRIGELQGVKTAVLYCRSGRRSHLVGPLLQAQGIAVEYLEGDFPGWAAAGLPVQQGSTPEPKEAR